MSNYFYVGTYTQGWKGEAPRKEGIYLYEFDEGTGRMTQIAGMDGGTNPSFLTASQDKKYLYAANEAGESMASALEVDGKTHLLKPLNGQATKGAASCYATIDPAEHWLVVANYSSGSVSVLPIAKDGKLGQLVDLVQHTGSGPNQSRQEAPHAHSARYDPSGKFLLVADLGIDKVMVYRQDPYTGKLTPNDPAYISTPPGSGPRHMEFDRNGNFLYVANEVDNTVTSFKWDDRSGTGTPLQVISTLPADFSGENTVADIHMTRSGKYLYVTNRGHNSVAAYAVDDKTGLLTLVGVYSCGGNWPRNFAIDPSDQFVLVANQLSNDIVVFQIQKDGSLAPTGQVAQVPAPVCIQFA